MSYADKLRKKNELDGGLKPSIAEKIRAKAEAASGNNIEFDPRALDCGRSGALDRTAYNALRTALEGEAWGFTVTTTEYRDYQDPRSIKDHRIKISW